MSASPAYPDPIADVARRQHGLFSVGQARSLRLNPTTIDRRLETGRYERLHPGVYRVAGAPDSREARYMAAVLAVSTAQDPAVLSHSSAAHLWRFGVRPDEMIHVVSETHHPGRLDGVKPHRTKALPVHHRTERDGIPVTSPERTLCELASCVGYTTLRKAVANAMRRNLVTAADLAATMYELGRIRGKTKLRMILAELTPLERDAREGIESLFLRVMTWAGFPPSAMNHPTRDAAGRSQAARRGLPPRGLRPARARVDRARLRGLPHRHARRHRRPAPRGQPGGCRLASTAPVHVDRPPRTPRSGRRRDPHRSHPTSSGSWTHHRGVSCHSTGVTSGGARRCRRARPASRRPRPRPG